MAVAEGLVKSMRTTALVACLLMCWNASEPAIAQQPPPGQPATGASQSTLQRMCSEGAEIGFGQAQLPNSARVLRERKQLRVLAMGATPLNVRDQTQGHYALVEKMIESSIKGVDVDIIDRGVSGELARDGAERIKTEVALVNPDLVFWQVGVADALALTPAGDLKLTLTRTIVWLKEHNVDIVLIGLRYQRSLAGNEGFQRIRKVIRDVVREQGILRIGHYESIEALDRVRRQQGEPTSELDLTDAGSNCLADFLSRALAVGLFAKPKPRDPFEKPPGGALPGAPPPSPPSSKDPGK
ncbi:MAG: SGNH/GDSL hydrolase family protein [Hyphomicrobiaceae bacterium]